MIQYIYVSFCWRSEAEAECCKIPVNFEAGGGCKFKNTAAVVLFQTGGICDDETRIQQQVSWEPGWGTETTLCCSFTFLLQQSSMTSETNFLLTNQSVCNDQKHQTLLPKATLDFRVWNMHFTCFTKVCWIHCCRWASCCSCYIVLLFWSICRCLSSTCCYYLEQKFTRCNFPAFPAAFKTVLIQCV